MTLPLSKEQIEAIQAQPHLLYALPDSVTALCQMALRAIELEAKLKEVEHRDGLARRPARPSVQRAVQEAETMMSLSFDAKLAVADAVRRAAREADDLATRVSRFIEDKGYSPNAREWAKSAEKEQRALAEELKSFAKLIMLG